jgi:hydrogenase-4 component E
MSHLLASTVLASTVLASTVAAPSALAGGANVIAVGVLLAEFGMIRQALLRDQVRLYAAQSVLLSALAIVVAATRQLPELYVLASLSFALKVVIVPQVLRRLLRGIGADGDPRWPAGGSGPMGYGVPPGNAVSPRRSTDIAGSHSLGIASTVLVAIAVAAFGFFTVAALGISSPVLPVTALSISAAVILVAFVLMIVRQDVISQAIGFLSLENGVSLTALVVAAGLPLVLEIAFLFDLLVVAVVFGLLIRVHHGRAESMSTADLTSLRG